MSAEFKSLKNLQQRSRKVAEAIEEEGRIMNLEKEENVGSDPVYTLNLNNNNDLEVTKKDILRLEELIGLIKKYPNSNQKQEWQSEMQEINQRMINSFRTPNMDGGAKKRRKTRRHRRRSQHRRRR
jgi:hypothetical protein